MFPTPSDEDKELITIIGKKEGVEAAKQELLKAIKDLVWKKCGDSHCLTLPLTLFNMFQNPTTFFVLCATVMNM